MRMSAGFAVIAFGLMGSAHAQVSGMASSGCVGAALPDCLSLLKQQLSIADSAIQQELARNNQVDVNGKRLARNNRLFLNGHWPGQEQSVYATVDFDDHGVTSIDIQLLEDPAMDRTEQQYQRSYLAQAVALAVGTSCADAQPPAVFRFFENSVKPKIESNAPTQEVSASGFDEETFQKASHIPFCGKSLTYTNLFGHDSDHVSVDNPTGVFILPSVIVYDH